MRSDWVVNTTGMSYSLYGYSTPCECVTRMTLMLFLGQSANLALSLETWTSTTLVLPFLTGIYLHTSWKIRGHENASPAWLWILVSCFYFFHCFSSLGYNTLIHIFCRKHSQSLINVRKNGLPLIIIYFS